MGKGRGSTKSPTRVRKRPRSNNAGPSAMRPPASDPASSSQRPAKRFSSFAAPTTEFPSTSMRSFTELLGNGASRAEQALGDEAPDDAWASLANTVDNLGSSMVLGTADFGDLTDKTAQKTPSNILRNRDSQLEADISEMILSSTIPIDLSIKKALKAFSPKSFFWTRLRGQGEESHALHDFVTLGKHSSRVKNRIMDSRPPIGSDAVPPFGEPTEEQVGAKRKFYQSLLHFRHPSFPLHSTISSNWLSLVSGRQIGGVRPERISEVKQLATQRLNDWQSALQSLYFGFRNGLNEKFYVVLASTTVVFSYVKTSNSENGLNKGTENSTKVNKEMDMCPRACISKATPGLRSLLSDQAVSFELLNTSDDGQDPCLLVEGLEEVHSLYNFLYTTGHKVSNARDVPILLSDTAFRWGSIVSAEVEYAKEAQRGGSGTGFSAQCSVSISGLFTPLQIKGICEAFSIMQENNFVLAMESEIRSTRLNISLSSGNGNSSLKDEVIVTGPRVLTKIAKYPDKEEYSYSVRDVE